MPDHHDTLAETTVRLISEILWERQTLAVIRASGDAGVDILALRDAAPLPGTASWPAYDAALTRLALARQDEPDALVFARGRVACAAPRQGTLA